MQMIKNESTEPRGSGARSPEVSKKQTIHIQESILLSVETAENLLALSQMLEEKIESDESRPLSHREYERRYREWRAKPPENIVNRANMVGIDRGVWAVDPFYRQVFASLHPEWTPTRKPGRPEGFSPARRQRLAKGEVIARLIELAGDTLRSELNNKQKAA